MSRSADAEPIERFLQRVQPQLRAMLARFSIPPREAEVLLRDIFLTLVYKRQSIASPERWLLRNLRQRCIAFWKQRKWQLYSRLDAALLQVAKQPSDGPNQRDVVSHELETVLAALPVACQGILRQRYGLVAKELAGESEQELAAGFSPSSLPSPEATEDFEACLATLSRRLVEFGFLDDEASTAVH